MRLQDSATQPGAGGIPAAPTLPDLPQLDLAPEQGCTLPVEAELAQVAALNAQLEDLRTALAAREMAIAAVEDGQPLDDIQAVAPPEGEAAAEVGDAAINASPSDSSTANSSTSEGAAAVPPTPEEAPATADATPAAPDAASDNTGFTPLTVADAPDLFQRVIALPGFMLKSAPGDQAVGQTLPVFSLLYVFDRREEAGTSWLHLGSSLREGPQGWAEESQALDWSTMLVMQFSPRGKRNPVLFFSEASTLRDMISNPFYQRDSSAIYGKLQEQRTRQAQGTEPEWPSDLVAVEPETAVVYDDRPYLLPILDWRDEMFDGTIDTTLLKVAAVPSAPAAGIGARDEASMSASAAQAALSGEEFRVGVVFVVDTTVSMRPFIERTYQAIEGFYDAFSRFETAQYVSFGLVGFRDTIESDPERLEYVTKVFQPLDTEQSARSVLVNMREMREATVSNLGFEEDAIAGMVDALSENDWSPYDARLMILVTDASARTDGKAKYPEMTLERLRESARANNITIVPVHLLTPANETSDAARAREQFAALAETGDLAANKYIALDATDPDLFARELADMAQEIASKIMLANSGEVVRDPAALMEPMPAAAAPDAEAPRLASVVGNEIFRAQLESLGRVEGAVAPAFLAGWAADRDLVNPEAESLEVSAYLTRNQLSTLDKRLAEIIEAFRQGGSDPQTFFVNLQFLAAKTSTDPDSLRSGDRSTIEAIMPSFLQKLPYRSKVLQLDQSYWMAMSVSQQQEFIEDLDAKRRIYADLFGQTSHWADLGAGDPGLEATPVRLSVLP